MLKGRLRTYKMRFTSGGRRCTAEPGVPIPGVPIPGVIMGVAMADRNTGIKRYDAAMVATAQASGTLSVVSCAVSSCYLRVVYAAADARAL